MQFRIEFGDANFTFGDCDCIWNSGFYTWRSRSNLETEAEFGDRYTRNRWIFMPSYVPCFLSIKFCCSIRFSFELGSGVTRNIRRGRGKGGSGHSVCVHEIRQKLQKVSHKRNKLALSQLRRLQIRGWNRKMCGVHYSSLPLPTRVAWRIRIDRNCQIGVHGQAPGAERHS